MSTKGISFCIVNTSQTFVQVSDKIIAGSHLCRGALVILIKRANNINTLGVLTPLKLLISMLKMLKIITNEAVLCVKKYVILAVCSWLFFLLFSIGINIIEFNSSIAHSINQCVLDINITNLST